MTYRWRWWYSVPLLPLWTIAVLLFCLQRFAPRENRRWTVAAVLLLPLSTGGLAKLTTAAVPVSSDMDLGGFLATVAATWAILFLAAPWLARTGQWRRYAAALALFFAAGLVGYVGFRGLANDGTFLIPLFFFWTAVAGILLLPMIGAGLCCRRRFGLLRFVLWLVAWTIVATGATWALLGGITIAFDGGGRQMIDVIGMLARIFLMLSIASGVLFITVHVPIVLLAWPLASVRDRIRLLFGHPESVDVTFERRDPWAGVTPRDDPPATACEKKGASPFKPG